MSYKKAFSFITKSVFVFFLLITNTIAPHAASFDYVFKIIWDDEDDLYNLRPDEVNFEIRDSATSQVLYSSGTVYASEEWTKNIALDSDWGKTVITTDVIPGYNSSTSIQSGSITKTFTSKYKDISNDIIVDTIWVDNDNANNTRPETYQIDVSDSFGNEFSYDIGKTSTEYVISDFPFIKDGVINSVSGSLNAVSGYTSRITTNRINGMTHFTVTHTLFNTSGDQFQPGFQTVSYNGATYNIYKMSGNEKLTIMTTPKNNDGTYPTMSIKKFAEVDHIRVKAVVNASYFNCNYSDVASIYDTPIYGRVQGMDTNGNYINSTTAGPGDGVSGDKPYMDLVIEPDGNVVARDMNSWDYHWGDDVGFPNEVMAGVSPAVIEILNGTVHEMYSPAVTAGKMTTKNTQTALIKTKDGSFALLTTTSKVAPRTDLKNFGVDYNLSELSVYDSGGSTQMMVGTTPIIYTTRTIPDVWIVYEEEPSVDPEEKTFSISFTDTDGGPDLSTYMIIRSLTEGSVSTGIAETINTLHNRGYEPVDDTWMNYEAINYEDLNDSVTEFNVNLKHIKENVVSHEEKTYTRTIKYVNTDGAALKDADIQTLHATVEGNGKKDLVTGEITYDSESSFVWENDNSTFPEVQAPEIEGYSPDRYTVSALNIRNLSEEDRNPTEEIKYTKKSTIVNVLVQYLDTDEKAPQDLSEYGATYSVNTALHEQIDLTPVINKLIDKHYRIVDKPIVDGKMQNVIVKVAHTTEEKSSDSACGMAVIPVEYDDSDKTETFSFVIDGKITSNSVTDLVTGETTGTSVDTCHVDPFAVPKKDGYIAEPELINGYAEGEAPSLPEKIVYKRIPPETKTVTVIFNDTNSDSQNLDAYSRQIVLTEGETKELDIRETLDVLEAQNYIIDYDTVPATISFEGDDTITVNVSHKTQTNETRAGETVYTREISFVDLTGNPLKNAEVQKATKYSILSETFDSVTGKKIASHYTTQWENGVNWFEQFAVPGIDGYETHESFVPKSVVNENNTETKVTIVYSKIADIHTFTVTFTDINTDSQDLTAYTKSYDIEMSGETSTALPEADAQIEAVKALGYKVIERPQQVTVSSPNLVVKVDHTYTESETSQVTEGVRTIHFTGIDKPDFAQKTNATIQIKRITDNVTGSVADTVLGISGQFPEYTPAVIEGYSFTPSRVPAAFITSEEDLSKEATVTYTQDPIVDIHTFTVEFTDINADAQDLSSYTKTYDLEMGGSTSTELHEADAQIDIVKNLGYTVVERAETVSVSNPKLTVKVDHTYSESEINRPINAVRTIHFNGIEKSDVRQEVEANSTVKRVTDNVTGKSSDTLISISGEYPEYVPEQIGGYTFTPDSIPAVTINSETALIMEATVTYTENQPVPDIHTFTVRFVDTNDDKQDLSSYSKSYDIEMAGQTSTALHEADAQIDLVKSHGYKVVERADEVTVTDPELVVKVDHTYSESTIDQNVNAVRAIHFEGVTKADVEQTVTAVKQIKRITDNATGKSSDTVLSINGTFPEYVPEAVEGYTFSPDRIPSAEITSEEGLAMSAVVTYTKNQDPIPDYSNIHMSSDLKFEDGKKEESVGTSFKLINTVSYSGLEPGRTYYVRTTLESELDVFTIASRPTGVIYEKDTEFIPENESGSLTTEIQMSAEDIDEDISITVTNKLLDSNKTDTQVSDEGTQAGQRTVNVKKNTPVIADRDVYVNFVDTDSKPRDLSTYRIKKTVKENEAVSVDFSSVYNALTLDGYKFSTAETTVTVPVDKDEVTISVTHRIDESVSDEKKTATRTIHFAGIERADDSQTAEINVSRTTKVDAVTKEVLSDKTEYSGKIPAYTVPQVDEYTSDHDTLPEINFENAVPETVKLNYETTVTYTSIYANMHDVQIQFTDINETEAQDLSYLNFVRKIKYDTQEDLNLSSEIQQLETIGYVLANGDEIPDKIGNESNVVVVKFTHTRTESDETFPIQVTRKISYAGVNRTADEQTASVTKTVHTVKDRVTGRLISTETTVSGEISEFFAPVIKGYEPDKLKLESVKFTEEAQLDGNYDAVIKYTRNVSTIIITFEDINDTDRTDLRKYTEQIDAYADFDLDAYLNDTSDSMKKLLEKGYVASSVESDGPDHKVLLKHKVESEESTTEKTIIRNIEFKYTSGIGINKITQNAYMSVVTLEERDAVTEKILKHVENKKAVPGKTHILEEVKSPSLNGFEASEKTIGSVDILNESVNDEETVIVIYKQVKKEESNKQNESKKPSNNGKQTVATPAPTSTPALQTVTKQKRAVVVNTADTFSAYGWIISFFISLIAAAASAKLLIDDDKARRRRTRK